jgi:hypothetical protein
MTNDEIINVAMQELKSCDKPYMLIKDFSFMNDINLDSNEYLKIMHLILRSTPFEKHTDQSVKFSSIGLTIVNDFKDWFAYKKSLKPKTDYAKWIAVLIALISLAWNIYQGITNNRLRDDNRIMHDQIEALEKDNAGLQNQIKYLNTNK